MPAFKAEKMRVNLRLCINRLKLLEKKKSEWETRGDGRSSYRSRTVPVQGIFQEGGRRRVGMHIPTNTRFPECHIRV